MKTYGVVWVKAGVTEIQEFEIPQPGPGEMIVETECSLISPGTERSWYLNRTGDRTYPMRPGYALSGRVHTLGEGVEGFRVGDPVVVDSRHAAHNLVNAARVLHIPEGVDFESASFYHLGNIGLLGARKARIEVGESVAVIGQGLVGLMTVQMARLQGGVPVVALDLEESRLEKSLICGADIVGNPADEGDMARILAELGERPAVVIEVTGAGEPISLALHLVRRLGRVVLLGSGRGEVLTDFNRDIHRPGVTVIGAQTGGRPQFDSRPGLWTWMDESRACLELMRRGRLETKSLITHRISGTEAASMFELVKNADPGLIGGVLQWR